MGSINLAYSSNASKGMVYWLHIKCFETKRAVTFEKLIEQEWNFTGIHVFMRTFYHNQVDSIFSSKVILSYQITSRIT